MMNILEKEDLIKGLPDNVLQQQMQAPTGELPQYLLISEIQRRTDMRKSLQEQPKQESVSDQIRMEGIMATRPQMPPQMQPPMGMEQPPMPMEQPPMGMAQGGVVRMRNLGKVPSLRELRSLYPNLTRSELFELARSQGIDVPFSLSDALGNINLPDVNIPDYTDFYDLRDSSEGLTQREVYERAKELGVDIPEPAYSQVRDIASDIGSKISNMQSAPPANNLMNNEVQMASIDELMNNSGINALGGIADKAREDLIRQRVQEYRPSSAGARSFNAFDPEDIPNIEVPATERGILASGMPVFQETSMQNDGISSLIESPGRLLSEAEMPEGRGVVTEASDERKSDKLDANRNIFERIPSIMEGIRSFDPSRLFPRTDKGYVYDVYDRKTDPVGDFYKDITSKNQPNPLYSTLGLPLAQEVVEGPGNLLLGELAGQKAGSKAQVTGVDDQTRQSLPQVLDINDRTEADKVIDVDTDVATDTGTADVSGGIASAGSGTPSVTDSGGLIERILGLVDKPSEAVSYADLIEQSRGRAKGEALTQLGLGIMGGSLQKGLSGASKAVSAARDAESKLSLQERIAQRDALNKDKSRDIQALSAAARVQQSKEGAAARLDQYEKALKRTMIREKALNARHIDDMAWKMSEAAVKQITDSTIQKIPEGFKTIEDYRTYMFNFYKKKFTDEMPSLDDEELSADLPGVSGRQSMKMINRTN